MPYVNFGTKNEQGFELIESPDLIAVRTRSRRPVRGVGSVARPTTAEVADGALVATFPDAGVEVYRIPVAGRSVDDRQQALRAAPDVQFDGSVLVYPDTDEPVLYTENLHIRFREALDDDCMVDATETMPIDKAAVYIRLEHMYIEDLLITVMPPASSGLPKVVLHNRAGGSRDNIEMLYDPSNTPALAAYSGKQCSGTWTVRIEDKAARDSGMLVQIGLHLFLPARPPVQGRAATLRTSRAGGVKVDRQPRGGAVRPRARG